MALWVATVLLLASTVFCTICMINPYLRRQKLYITLTIVLGFLVVICAAYVATTMFFVNAIQQCSLKNEKEFSNEEIYNCNNDGLHDFYGYGL